MTDEALLGYIETHSETELALTSGRDVKRLLTLAGENPDTYFGGRLEDRAFYNFYSEQAHPLVKRARENLTGQMKIWNDLDNPS